MRRQRRATQLLCLVFTVVLIGAACSSDDKKPAAGGSSESGSAAPEAPKPQGCFSSTGKVCEGSPLDGKPAKFSVTIDLVAEAKWDDGTPIGIDDFQCTADAALDTPGSILSNGYDRLVSVEKGTSDQQIVVSFDQVYAPYKNLFTPIIKKAAVENCQDISADFQDSFGFSGRPWKLDSFTKDQEILVPNDAYWDEKPQATKVVMNPVDAGDTEVTDLKTGGHDFIFPQPYAGFDAAISDPNVKAVPGAGLQYENLYFQNDHGPFADDAFRKAFLMSIDRDALFNQIYKPIFPSGEPLTCFFWIPKIGPWCAESAWKDNTLDTAGAESLLTGAGYTKNGDGLWAKDGKAPTLRWLTNGNPRRSDMQDYLIPKMRQAGFDVVKDNCDNACAFQQRIPALDYEITTYISQVTPDPSVTNLASCEQVPSEANNNKGQNSDGWCNQDATKLMHDSDAELDTTKRTDMIHQIDDLTREDAIGLPLFQFPNISAWRTDRLSGPVSDDTANYRAFAHQLYRWKTSSSDGIIKIGSEQWPDCLNPITECGQSSWAVWMGAWNVLPNAWDTNAAGEYLPSPLLKGEPTTKTL